LILSKDLLSLACATTAARSNTQRFPELKKIIHTVGGSPADLFVGNGFADADVHLINNSTA
jgi:hypothetical protein